MCNRCRDNHYCRTRVSAALVAWCFSLCVVILLSVVVSELVRRFVE